tara:strand:+ start:282 stop:599 length:318 start_codon:yes stop_codon:yes gene_type:complete
MNVKSIKLKNSEEILCEIVKETEETLTLKNCCVLVPSGQTGIAMAPWLPFAKRDKDSHVEISKDNVLFMFDVIDEIKEQYEQQFGSGLIQPKSKIMTPSDLKLTT